MLYLNLDPEYKPFAGEEILHETSTFKGGEDHIKIKEFLPHREVTITHRVNSSSDLMKVILANDALQRIGHERIHLYIPYLPYARQDRVMVKGEPLSIKVFTKLINACEFRSVTVLDPHSEVGTALLDRVKIQTNRELVDTTFVSLYAHGINKDEIAVISPDAGAYKKIYKTCESINYKGQIVLCNKVRDLGTGEIISLTVDGTVENKVCVIIDDICDGGRTFIELATQLRNRGAKSVILIVTHGIFSYGVEPLQPVIDHVYTTNSIQSFKSPFVTFFQIS
jgi:ribose-phosphate pyrophosphokinase